MTIVPLSKGVMPTYSVNRREISDYCTTGIEGEITGSQYMMRPSYAAKTPEEAQELQDAILRLIVNPDFLLVATAVGDALKKTEPYQG